MKPNHFNSEITPEMIARADARVCALVSEANVFGGASHLESPSPASKPRLELSKPRLKAILPALRDALSREDLESPGYLVRLGRHPVPSSATLRIPGAGPENTPPPPSALVDPRRARMLAPLRPLLRWILLQVARMYDAAAPLTLTPREWKVDAYPRVRFEGTEEAGAGDTKSLVEAKLELERFWHEISLRDAGCLGQRESITNSAVAEAREGAVSNAAEEPFDAADDGWMKIAPFGSYPGSRPGRLQNFTEMEANAMVGEFRSLRGKLGRMFRGAPVYIGHPDKDPVVYTDHRRLGKVTELQVRADGLYGEVEWNALGLENKREGYWVYPSPRWDAPAGRPEFRPDRLISVGLTNTPRIADSEPVTNSALDSDTETPTNTDMDRKLLTEKLGLDVTATDEEILGKITQIMSEAETATTKTAEAETAKTEKETAANSLLEAESKIITFEAALQSAREAHANSQLDAAEAAGRITKAERAEWLPKLTGESREAEANSLLALAPKLNTQSLDVSKSRVEIGDEKSRRETISNAVDAHMQKGMNYDEAWAAAKKDPELHAIWTAMKTEE